MALRQELTEVVGEVFTDLADEFESGFTVKLLRTSADYDEFDELLTLTSNVFFEYENDRKRVRVEVGRDDDELTEAMQEATHLEIADKIWEINRGDTFPPSSTDVTWKLTGELNTRDVSYSDL
jgi:hypothetical protein